GCSPRRARSSSASSRSPRGRTRTRPRPSSTRCWPPRRTPLPSDHDHAPGYRMSGPRRSGVRRPPTMVLEALRLLVVVFFAGAGYQIGTGVSEEGKVLGPLNGTAIGLILGSGLG